MENPTALPHPNPTTPLIVLVWFSHGYFHFSLHKLAPYPSLAAERISSKSSFSSSTDAMRSLYSSHPEETESRLPQRTGGHAAEVTVYGEDAQSPPPHRKPRDQVCAGIVTRVLLGLLSVPQFRDEEQEAHGEEEQRLERTRFE